MEEVCGSSPVFYVPLLDFAGPPLKQGEKNKKNLKKTSRIGGS